MSESQVHTGVRQVVVPADRAGQRLDNFLLGLLGGVPRSLVYRLVRTGQVRVNARRAKPMQKLQAGDEVRVPPVAMRPDLPARVPDAVIESIRSSVIEANPDYVVLDKPSGLAVHGGSGLAFGLMDAVAAMKTDWRPVHRLDRATSGLLVLACRHASLVALQRSFARREVDKRYLALLSGELREDSIIVDQPLKKIRDSSGQHRVIVAEDGQSALTRFRVLERLPGYSYVEATIETGRTHQIRAHAAAIGHPLVGDERYNQQPPPALVRRLFLHAHYLRLSWPEERIYSSPLPEDLGQALDQLRTNRVAP